MNKKLKKFLSAVLCLIMLCTVISYVMPMASAAQIYVNISGTKNITLEVEYTETIADIKQKIQDEEGIPPEKQKLLYNGKELQDEMTLADYNIRGESTVYLIVKKVKSYSVGEIIEFGSYPQTEIVSQASDSGTYGKEWGTESDYIIDTSLYNTLKNLSEDQWDLNGDATVGENKYRRIKEDDATCSKSEEANFYDWSSSETYHYFKYESIKWRVLQQNGKDIFLLSEIALDDQMYNTNITGDITWENSTLRSWLNGYDSSLNAYGTDYSSNNFINSAFSSEEQLQIKTTAVENKDNSKSGTEGGNDTNDKIFLLSEDETYGETATSYGFSSSMKTNDTARMSKSSTYAKAMGAESNCESDNLGNCYWWLRSPGSYAGLFSMVQQDGVVYRGGQHANSKSRGIRPAMHISLSYEDDLSGYDLNYNWSSDGKECIATLVCENDSSAVVIESGKIISVEKSPATCTAEGITTYSAVFDSEFFSTQTVDIADIPEKDHTFVNYVYNFDATTEKDGTETATCLYCTATYTRIKSGTKIEYIPNQKAIISAKSASVDYRTIVTLSATATGMDANSYLVIYEGEMPLAKGEKGVGEVTYEVGEMKESKNYSVRIVDENGITQSDGDENLLKKDVSVTVNAGFFKIIAAFFKGLFGLLPTETI